ncbi:GvpL/GvpF family gas vesicle protein [Candidatus Bathyarchaeota archaeon]|nr:GvpL/GvpF family gas vesicle protein [Candidatus Bathyarchaeota archaeon]
MSLENNSEEGRYLYCIVSSGNEKDFGKIGVEDSSVYIVAFNDIGAVVHRCEAKPYETATKEKAGKWLLAHQYVVDLATEEFGTVIPLTFDTILKGDNERLKKWLSEEYQQLKDLSTRLEGKAEYGVQIFLENDFVDRLLDNSQEIQDLKKKLETTGSGASYLLKKKLEHGRQLEKQLAIDKYAKDLYTQIEKLVNDVKIGSTSKEVPEKWKGKQMILNVACLAHKDKVENLGNMLGALKNEGFAVRFTGPWPPYSFVGQINESKIEGSR